MSGSALGSAQRGLAANRARRLGILIGGAGDAEGFKRCDVIIRTLGELGWVDGETLSVDPRWTLGDTDLTARSASAMLLLKPDVILTHGPMCAEEVLRRSGTVPLVFAAVFDPLHAGLVRDLAAPGGSCTGFMDFAPSKGPAALQLLRDLSPQTEHVALLWNPRAAPYTPRFVDESLRPAARNLGVSLSAIAIDDAGDLEPAIAALARRGRAAFAAMADPFMTVHRKRIVDLAARHRVAAVYPSMHFVNDGGLASYGVDHVDVWRRAAGYIDRIFRGAKPGDLPVQPPAKFEVGINVAAAKVVGVTVPATLLMAADKIVD
ncbi:MAG TPA: ABC transporter substrate-binding protein [Terriglobales bacterium]|nr:ABC transporter substrate-binding protein [Terriglobales bacterium]